MKHYFFLVTNIVLLIIFFVDWFTAFNSVLGIVGFFCPFVTLFSLSYLMDKGWKDDIHKKINVIGQTMVGLLSIGYMAFIFLIL